MIPDTSRDPSASRFSARHDLAAYARHISFLRERFVPGGGGDRNRIVWVTKDRANVTCDETTCCLSSIATTAAAAAAAGV
jgi:hypothetical protein